MSFESARALSFPAGGVIAQHRFVVVADAGTVDQAGANAEAIGVALEAAAAAGDVIPVGALDGGKLEVEAGAAIDVSSAAVLVTSDASGRAVAATTGQRILGVALTSAANAGEFVTIAALKGAIAAP